MNRVLLSTLLLVVAASVSAAPQQAKDVREITQLVRDIHRAVIRRDHAFLERAFADDFVNVTWAGTVETKQQYLAAHRAGRRKFERSDLDDFQVRTYGNTALVFYRNRWKGRIPGKEMEEGTSRAIRVFVRRNGQWRCVAAQYTRLQP
jgi:ketosteroid isomerase-like protein